MSRRIQHIRLLCLDCRHEGSVAASVLEERFGESLTYSNIAEFWPKFRCGKCRSGRVALSGEDGRLLINPDNLRRCASCRAPILIPRMEVLPHTNVFQSCAEDGEGPAPVPRYPMPPPELASCPRCKAPTVVRENAEDGEYFIGCTGYPKCRWTSELPEDRI